MPLSHVTLVVFFADLFLTVSTFSDNLLLLSQQLIFDNSLFAALKSEWIPFFVSETMTLHTPGQTRSSCC